MPNTKSAERRVRSSARKQQKNHSVKSELHTLEKKYLRALPGENRDEATAAFRNISSALDKAAKKGVVPKATANRKKSRLAVRLNVSK
ncbi:MAG: 30S ribosomal protein S20 [Verrucomicrobia bacterium]|nr:30S ribosomal protein S20 [Verrucomicrobiota bacterium]